MPAGTEAELEAKLSTVDRMRLIAEILVAYVRVRWLLRRQPLPAVVASLRGAPPRGLPTSDRRLTSATVRVLSLLPTDGRCLVRTLVVLALLARRGRDAQVVVGVRRETGFLAHAWLEREGVELLPAGTFQPLVRL